MIDIQLKSMSRYRRSDFDEDQLCPKNDFDKTDVMGFTNINSFNPQFFASSEQTLTEPESNKTTTSKKEDESLFAICSEPSSFSTNKPSAITHTSVIINKNRLRKRNFWTRLSSFEKLLFISFFILIIFLFSLLLLILNNQPNVARKNKEYCLSPACITVASAIINSMDLKTDPCQDFYQYACGGWFKNNPLPEGKSVWGTFAKLWQDNQYVMKNVLEEEDANQSKAEEKSRVYYRSCLDINETIEKLNSKPLEDFLIKIGGWNVTGHFNITSWDFQKTVEIIHIDYNIGELFSWAVGADAKNSSVNIIQIDQGALSLPSREYYLNKTMDDEVFRAFLTFMCNVGVLLGAKKSDIVDQMKDVIIFETRLAKITATPEERSDDERVYNRMTLRELQELAPAIDWISYFKTAFAEVDYPITPNELVVVYSKEYFSNLSNLINEYKKDSKGKIILANYLSWTAIQSLISCLSKSFRDASKVLRKALIGSEGTESTWRYCVSDTNGFMGFALGAMFVKSVFKGDSKTNAEVMVEEVRKAFEENLQYLRWIDPETRKLAEEKAKAITDMIGYPEFILNSTKLDEKYEGLEFNENAYFENNIKVNKFALRKNMEKIKRPANKNEWEMTPSTVNAYYTPTKDTMVFPAGILQAPFYDSNYPKSINYGAMGVVIGHELTHAFDDRGRKYDKNGNLNQWWQNSTIKNFEEKINCFVEQYSAYKVNGESVSGERTLGENVADNGGLKAAYHAYKSKTEFFDDYILPGVNLTDHQLFFVRFAQVWCSVSTNAAMKLQILNDSHSPPKYRVIGTLSNSKEFTQVFNCPLNSPMNPKKKCEIW